MRIAYMGTPDFAADILESIADSIDIACVYTRPDAVRGRGKKLTASPVKEVALKLGIEVRTPSTLRDETVQHDLAALGVDVIVVAAYGMILPREVLDIPPLGCVNVHASLLPRWRGAAPIERAILEGDVETGVCIMRMEEGLDTGDYCVRRLIPIEDMTVDKLRDELSSLGAAALMTALVQIEAGAARWVRQDESETTYAKKIQKGELNLSPEDDAIVNIRRVRASSDAHPSKCVIADREVTMLAVRAVDDSVLPELIAAFDAMGSGIACFYRKKLYLMSADRPFEVSELKPAGKSAMDAKAFAAGVPSLRGGAMWRSVDG